MKAKFFAPALLALPLGLIAFKPADVARSANLESIERVSYEAIQGQNSLLSAAGFLARKSSVTKSVENSTVVSEAAVASFSALKTDNLSLAQFVNDHE